MMRSWMWIALALLLAAPVAAQQGGPQAEAEAAIAQLRSPYCPGLMLEVCPSPQAAALRDSLRALAAEQELSSAELVEWMIARHGEEWRGVPRSRGRGLWAWLIPPAVLLAGAGVVAARLRRDRARVESRPTPQSTLSEADRDRVAAALREMERAGELDA
jgi:cytochrome c-type biogenesis protein CcmH/NrfF